MDYRIDVNVAHRPGETWHLAHGGNLGCRVWFKLGRARDEQWVCTEVDIESDRPITSTLLRNIPMSEIVDRLLSTQLEYADRGGPLDLATGIREWYDGGSMVGLTLDELAAGGATAHLSREEVEVLYLGTPDGKARQPRATRGGAGPSESELERFAQAYKKALQTDRRSPIAKAMLTLEREHGLYISRASANRWRDECRRRGLLDPK
ncbi:hypothetical protein [Leifsonia sp. P73]|uniref:hypothetical protein n=1 Tax=Leifsonia sp. P73 TaxID=3423959 RepID=UPI003DA44D5F